MKTADWSGRSLGGDVIHLPLASRDTTSLAARYYSDIMKGIDTPYTPVSGCQCLRESDEGIRLQSTVPQGPGGVADGRASRDVETLIVGFSS